ncbi:MAG: dTMP kinase [bacterium]|nr:dTMP kinase [bacterium]
MNQKNGIFLVFEGGEGSGKTTQAKLLADELRKMGHEVLLTKEPGGDEGICRDIRALLLNPVYSGKMSNLAELLLFEADRAQHLEKEVRPALQMGVVVISDRFEAATFAYQCVARQVCSPDDFWLINNIATNRLRPDMTFWIDVEPSLGLQRNINAKKRDRFEMENVDFHRKVRAGYRKFFDSYVLSFQGEKFDGAMSINELHVQILEAAKKMISGKLGK